MKTEHVSAEDVEFLRWKTERWIKARHIVESATKHFWMLRSAPSLLFHTFRGSTLKSVAGLEDERAAFRRYRALRAAERTYI